MRKIIIILILSSLMLSGCGVIEDDSSSPESKAAAAENSEDSSISETEPISDDCYTNAYLKIAQTDEWKQGFSDENTVIFHNKMNDSCSVGFEVDDSDDHPTADAAAAEIRSDYSIMGFKLNKKGNTEIAGFEAVHLLFLKDDEFYYEYYYFECNKVLYNISIIQDKESYENIREEEEEFISTAQFTCKNDNVQKPETQKEQKTDAGQTSDLCIQTMEDIYNANKNESVLKHYNRVQTSVTIGEYSALLYADKKFTYITGDDICEGESDCLTCSYDNGKYLTEFSLDKEKVNTYEKILFLNDRFSDFVISDAEEDGDDLVITASLSESDTAEFMNSMSFGYDDGAAAILKLRVNKNDLIIQEYSVESTNTEDSETVITVTNNYDCGLPAEAENMFDHMNLPDLRTITLIVNPGSENEYTLTATGIKGDEIQFYSVGDINMSQYEDKGCTKEYTSQTDADKNADLVIYGKEF